MTYYDILGVPQTASKDDIKKAYRKLAQDYHPDKLSGVPPAVAKLAEERFKDVQEAYEILTKRRVEYDNQLRAVVPPPPTPSQPRPPSRPSPASTKPTTPHPSSKVRSRINSALYYTGRVIGKAWKWFSTEPYAPAKVAFGAIGLTVIIAFVTSTISDKASSPVTPQKQTLMTQSSSNAAVAQTQPSFVGQQNKVQNKVLQTPIKAATKTAEQFGGIVHNQTASASAEFGIVFQDTNGALSGCMAVGKPLFGSGPLSGHVAGADISFEVTSAIGTIKFTGKRSTDDISGIYRVENGSGPVELGTFALNKVKSSNVTVGTDCPTDAEVHRQPVKQIASNDAVLKTGDIVVYYAADWEKVSSDCSLLTIKGRESISLPRSLPPDRMMCGNIYNNYSDWSRVPHFTTRIILDGSAAQNFKANTQLLVSLSCAGRLEANGDLHCKADANKKSNLTPEEFALKRPAIPEQVAPKPTPRLTPKYVALGHIKCYTNQRVALYADETLTKASRQLGPGEDIYKVGTFGDSVGVNFGSYYVRTKPTEWLDGRDIDKLTCGR